MWMKHNSMKLLNCCFCSALNLEENCVLGPISSNTANMHWYIKFIFTFLIFGPLLKVNMISKGKYQILIDSSTISNIFLLPKNPLNLVSHYQQELNLDLKSKHLEEHSGLSVCITFSTIASKHYIRCRRLI